MPCGHFEQPFLSELCPVVNAIKWITSSCGVTRVRVVTSAPTLLVMDVDVKGMIYVILCFISNILK
jgi:hypothetical protein